VGTIDCEIAEITITVDGVDQARLSVPAYTREMSDFIEGMGQIIAYYVDHQSHPSYADFAMFVLAQAAQDPTQQEE
jgi:hypothetical protein